MLALKVEKVRKIFPSLNSKGQEVLALDDVSLEVNKNEFYSILGHSGCGKTTLLNLIAGFEVPTAGYIVPARYCSWCRSCHGFSGLRFVSLAYRL